MANLQSKESNPWNPFEPTQRDIQRTNELSQKNHVVAGVLSLFFLPVGMIYLNRGINSLKILGYVFVFAFVFALMSNSEEEAAEIGNGIGVLGSITIVAEQVNTVIKARQRKKVNEQ